MDPNIRVPKNSGWKDWYGDESTIALAKRDHVIRQRHLRSVELFVVEHAQKYLRRWRNVYELEIDTIHCGSAVDQRPRMVIVAAAYGQLTDCHPLLLATWFER